MSLVLLVALLFGLALGEGTVITSIVRFAHAPCLA